LESESAERRGGGAVRTAGVAEILFPKWRSVVARLRKERSGAGGRLLLLVLVGGGFWAGTFRIAYWVLKYLGTTPDIGALLAGKILSMLLLAFGSILLLSNLVTALSTFFLAKDLDTLVAAPVDWGRLYLAKLFETMIHSSWMVALMLVPILTAYGVVYHGGWLFPLAALGALIPVFVFPTVIGSAITLTLVNVFPARRTRDLLTLIGLGAVGGVVLLLRVLRPEQLSRPEGFRNLVDFVAQLKAPSHPLMPTEWAATAIMNWLQNVADPLPLFLLWSTAGAAIVMGAALHSRLHPSGFSKAQEGADKYVAGHRWQAIASRLLAWLPVTRREFILKDLRVFFRDATQWSQLILLAVLLIVYVFNIQALPLYTGERVPYLLVTLVVFLNQGLAGFVLAAIAARFIFPSVSLEGRQLWLLRSSPLDLRAMLWSKYWVGTAPLLIVALAITIVTNGILRASPFMMFLSVVTIACFTMAAGSLALSLGVLFPHFDTENAAQIPTSFGGVVFMMSAIMLLAGIIIVEARPVSAHLQAFQMGIPTEAFSPDLWWAIAKVFTLCALATLLPLHKSLRRLQSLEV
jgi:ABC-2 type transport system permease protein